MKLGTRQKKWIKALRSGKYEQGPDKLRSVDNKFCCLGVACDIYDKKLWKFDDEVDAYTHHEGILEILSNEVTEYFGLVASDGEALEIDNRSFDSLVTMNDEGVSFKRIALKLEQHPERYFKESK